MPTTKRDKPLPKPMAKGKLIPVSKEQLTKIKSVIQENSSRTIAPDEPVRGSTGMEVIEFDIGELSKTLHPKGMILVLKDKVNEFALEILPDTDKLNISGYKKVRGKTLIIKNTITLTQLLDLLGNNE